MNSALRIGMAAWAAQALLQLVWHAWWVPPTSMPIAIALTVALLPLALPLLAMRRPVRALLLVGMLSLFYFCHGIAEAWTSPPERNPALLEILFALVVIAALGVNARRRRTATV